MKIEDYHIRKILKRYGIEQDIKNIIFLHEQYGNNILQRVRVIIKVELRNESIYIIKFVCEEEHPQILIEEQSIFSECLRENGIITAKRLKCDYRHCILYHIYGVELAVTVEEYLGEEITFINHGIVNKIANMMAEMHNISKSNNCHINGNTIWDIFDDKTDIMRGYMEFYKFREDKDIDLTAYNLDLYNKIIELYNERKERLKVLWDKLPKYATQGDYSINNLTNINGQVGIFDYNISGDEVLVSDMVIEGLFVAKHMELDKELTDKDRELLFQSFIKTYMDYCKLTQNEINAMNDIYAIVLPFWWTRIIYDEEKSLKKLLKDKNVHEVNAFLEETYEMLRANYFNKN
ncbi:hypothetical protein [Clostridium sp.]|uniref:hypothetical protein n=1 Tax=Clostridium sp. TaxID=1506 RepID=UPI00321693BA